MPSQYAKYPVQSATGITSINGNSVSAQIIAAGTGISVSSVAGTTTITNTSPGSGTVTSVGLTLPVSVFSVAGSPVTTSGTLAGSFVNQSANTIFSGPTSGGAAAPAFRALVSADIPSLSATYALINLSNLSSPVVPANLTITGPQIFLGKSGVTNTIQVTCLDGTDTLLIAGGSTGGQINLYGEASGTLPHGIQFLDTAAANLNGQIDGNGIWTIGRSGAGSVQNINGSLGFRTVGTGVAITEATNAHVGVATLVAGTVTVPNNSIGTSSRYFLTKQYTGTPVTLGAVMVSSVVPGTSFTITSENAADTSDVAWFIVQAL